MTNVTVYGRFVVVEEYGEYNVYVRGTDDCMSRHVDNETAAAAAKRWDDEYQFLTGNKRSLLPDLRRSLAEYGEPK